MTHPRIVTPPSPRRRHTSIGRASIDDDSINGLDPRDLRILEAAFHEAALDYAEDPTTTPEDEADVAALAAFVAELTRGP